MNIKKADLLSLIHKYDKIAPRYTSYPTAPEWSKDFDFGDWQETVQADQSDLSLYFHIPFCKAACSYCACNIVVNPRRLLVEPYLQALYTEIDFVSQRISPEQQVRQLHFGGGTPTYLEIGEFECLLGRIRKNFSLDDSQEREFSIEIDPRVTSKEQLKYLYDWGFNRLSLGVQDFTPQVQQAVNRIQDYDTVSEMVNYARELGFESINFDLIYGLPHQTPETFRQTIEQVLTLKPARIALFSYAHLPSLRPFQKAYIDEKALPTPQDKLTIFLQALEHLQEAGYEYIGLDHFALEEDELCIARHQKTLHRNFQGYTTKAGLSLISMGITSISSIDNIYSQNSKNLKDYIEHFKDGAEILPLEKGIKLKEEDVLRREIISQILCHGEVDFVEIERRFGDDVGDFGEYFAEELADLQEMIEDGLVSLTKQNLEVTELGRVFLRNIASVFDAYLRESSSQGQHRIFSRTV